MKGLAIKAVIATLGLTTLSSCDSTEGSVMRRELNTCNCQGSQCCEEVDEE